jgi:hypothetical protein
LSTQHVWKSLPAQLAFTVVVTFVVVVVFVVDVNGACVVVVVVA